MSLSITGTFDIECSGWDRFMCGVLYRPSTGPVIYRDADAMVDALGAAGGTWWAHAGGTYDLLLAAERFRARGIRAAMHLSGARISRLVGGGVVLCDSWLLAPMGLERLAQLAGREAPRDLGWECRCRDRCGGYCQIRPGMPAKRRLALEAYCAHDAATLYAALDALRAFAETHQIELRGTIGGSAWETARRRLGLPVQALTPATWRRVRSAYYGGRVIVGKPYSARGEHFDLRSAYPAALHRTAVPLGDHREVGRARAGAAYRDGRPGVYRATVTIPEMHVPPLPVRYGERVGFPVGTVTGSWVEPELRAAEQRGVTIDAIHAGVVWSGASVLFADLVADWHALRRHHGGALGDWLRLFANSLTGKLAESPDREMVRMHCPTNEIKICRGDVCGRVRCTGRCGAYRQIDDWGVIWAVPYYRPADSAHVQWAAYLTASTREQLLLGAERVGHDLVYSDTDSIWTCGNEEPGDIGELLGQWARVESYGEMQIMAPKVYRYLTLDGEERVRAAGINRVSPTEWAAAVRGERIERKRGVYTLRESAPTGKLFRRRVQHWGLGADRGSGWFGDRYLAGEIGITYPATHGQLEERYARR